MQLSNQLKTTISQPRYLPWLGYLDRIAKSDIFVILDTVQFQPRCWQRRNKIKTQYGEKWLTIPVAKTSREALISEIKVNGSSWQDDHWRTIKGAYKRSPNWGKYRDKLFEVYEESKNIDSLTDINQLFLNWLFSLLSIKAEIVRASSLDVSGKGDELLRNICLAIGANEYISGINGKSYIEDKTFAENSIKLTYLEYTHPVYQQQFGGEFVQGLMAIDYIMNSGEMG